MTQGFKVLDFNDFHRSELPLRLSEGNGALAAGTATALGSLAFRLNDGAIGDEAYTYVARGTSIDVLPGDENADTVVTLSRESWGSLRRLQRRDSRRPAPHHLGHRRLQQLVPGQDRPAQPLPLVTEPLPQRDETTELLRVPADRGGRASQPELVVERSESIPRGNTDRRQIARIAGLIDGDLVHDGRAQVLGEPRFFQGHRAVAQRLDQLPAQHLEIRIHAE